MHVLVARNEHDDACTAKHCISYQKFAMQIIEQVIRYLLIPDTTQTQILYLLVTQMHLKVYVYINMYIHFLDDTNQFK